MENNIPHNPKPSKGSSIKQCQTEVNQKKQRKSVHTG